MRRFAHILVIMWLGLSLSAQTHYEGKFSIGGKAGVTLSRTQFSPSVPQTLLPGYMFGCMFRYIEEKHFGLIAELNVEQRGWRESYEDLTFSYQRRFTYVQLPFLTHIYFGNHRIKGFFNAGPEIGLMIANTTSSNFDYENTYSIEGFPINYRQNEQLTLPVKHKFDYGISAGAGMEVGFGRQNSIMLEGRFYYGLHDVFSNHKKDPFSGSSGMSIMISLGYYYQL